MEFYRNLINENLVAFVMLAAAAFFAFVFLIASVVLLIRKKRRRGAAVKALAAVGVILLAALFVLSAALVFFVFPTSLLSVTSMASSFNVNLFGLTFIVPGLVEVLTALAGSVYGWMPLVIFAVFALLFLIVKKIKTYKVKRAKVIDVKPELVNENIVSEQSGIASAQSPVLEPAAEVESETSAKQQLYEETVGGSEQAFEEETYEDEPVQELEEEACEDEPVHELEEAYEDEPVHELEEAYEDEPVHELEEEAYEDEPVQTFEEAEEYEYEFDDLPITDDELLEQLSMFEEAPASEPQYEPEPEPQHNPEPVPQDKTEPVPQYNPAPQNTQPAVQAARVVIRSDAAAVFASYDRSKYIMPVRSILRNTAEETVKTSESRQKPTAPETAKKPEPPQKMPEPEKPAAKKKAPAAKKQEPQQALPKTEPVKADAKVSGDGIKAKSGGKIKTVKPEAVDTVKAPLKSPVTVEFESVPKTGEREIASKTGERAGLRPEVKDFGKAAAESDAGLPVKRRIVLQSRYNAVNVFSDYLNQKNRTERQRLEDSLNVITIK